MQEAAFLLDQEQMFSITDSFPDYCINILYTKAKSSISIFKQELDCYTSTRVLHNFSIPIVQKTKRLWRALLMGEVLSLVSLKECCAYHYKSIYSQTCALQHSLQSAVE